MDDDDFGDVLDFAPPIAAKCRWCGQPLDRFGSTLPTPKGYNPKDTNVPGKDICEMCCDIQNMRIVEGITANDGSYPDVIAKKLTKKLDELLAPKSTDEYLSTLHFDALTNEKEVTDEVGQ